eukprot:Skav213065  [mRNA]  locus=scaffold364:641029:642661:- [translate_table: standard]
MLTWSRRKTIQDAMSSKALEYIGAVGESPEASDVLAFHSSVLLYQLEGLNSLCLYEQSFPWRWIQMLDASAWTTVLADAKKLWTFVIDFCDLLRPTDSLFLEVGITRAQNFRDCMTKAEHFDFDATRMRTPASSAFEKAVLAVAGLQSASDFSSLLSSLPSELCFNDLRDACRRHSKQERASPSSLHSVASKSCSKHPFGCKQLEISDRDWATPTQRNQVKVAVHDALRTTDKELGISAEGLTKHKSNRNYTRPRVFTDRLEFLGVISRIFHDFSGSIEEKSDRIHFLHSKLWVSKVFPELWLIHKKNDDDDAEAKLLPKKCFICTRAGPYLVGCLRVRKDDEGDHYKLAEDPYLKFVAHDLYEWEVARCQPVVIEDGGVAWRKHEDWMSVLDYIADEGILKIPAVLLGKVVATLKLKAGRLDHVHLAELFLRHMSRSEQWIQTVVEQLAAKQRKRKTREKKPDEEDWFEGGRGTLYF